MPGGRPKKRGAKSPPVLNAKTAIRVIKLLPPREAAKLKVWLRIWLERGETDD